MWRYLRLATAAFPALPYIDLALGLSAEFQSAGEFALGRFPAVDLAEMLAMFPF